MANIDTIDDLIVGHNTMAEQTPIDEHAFVGITSYIPGTPVPDAKTDERTNYSEVMRDDGFLHQQNYAKFVLKQFVPGTTPELARQMIVRLTISGKRKPDGSVTTTGETERLGHLHLTFKTTKWHTRGLSRGINVKLQLAGRDRWKNFADGRVFGSMTINDTAKWQHYFTVNERELTEVCRIRAVIRGEPLWK